MPKKERERPSPPANPPSTRALAHDQGTGLTPSGLERERSASLQQTLPSSGLRTCTKLGRQLQAQRLPPRPRGLAVRVQHGRPFGREGQPLPVLGTGAAERCPPPQEIDQVGPEHVSVP